MERNEELNILETFDGLEGTGRIMLEADYTKGSEAFAENEARLGVLPEEDSLLARCEEEYVIRFSYLAHLVNRLAKAQKAKWSIAFYEKSKQAIFRLDSDGMALGGKQLAFFAELCALAHGMIATSTEDEATPHRLEFSFLLFEDPSNLFYHLVSKLERK